MQNKVAHSGEENYENTLPIRF